MAEKKEKKKFIDKLRHKYRLIIYNDSTLEEVWHTRLSRLNVFTTVGISGILFTALVIVLIAFTPLKEYIPGFPDGNMLKTIRHNTEKVDSLERIVKSRTMYLQNLKNIVSGNPEMLTDSIMLGNIIDDSSKKYSEIDFSASARDSLLRKKVSENEKYNLQLTGGKRVEKSFSNLHFFAPVRGMISSKFNFAEGHYGIDIVAEPSAPITAIMNGTVIMSAWTLETGYVIGIQHDYNITSFYKHNSVLLKKMGDRVKAGESIAIIGNSGEMTTGPHLHFELWHNGTPVNPTDFIIF